MSLWWWLLLAIWFLFNFIVLPPLLFRFARWLGRRRWWKKVERVQDRIAGWDDDRGTK